MLSFLASCARCLTPVTLELGSKAVFTVCQDANIGQVGWLMSLHALHDLLFCRHPSLASCVQRLMPDTLELGGKDVFIMCQIADASQAGCPVCLHSFDCAGGGGRAACPCTRS